MSETEEDIRRVKSSFGASQSSIPKLQSQVPFNLHDINQHSNSAQFHAQYLQISPELNVANSCKRIGIPPAHPQSPKPSFFSLDSSPLSLYSHRDPISGPTSDQAVGDVSLPPRKTHRRSNSDIPFGFSTILQSSPPLIPSIGSNGFNNPWSKLVKRESNWEKIGCENKNKDEGKGERISEGEVVDDVFSSCINLNNLGTKTNFGGNSDNEATSSIIGNNNMQISGNFCPISDNKKEGIIGGDIAPTIRHYRSVSMDSVMGNMNFVDESINSILAPSPGGQIGNLAVSDSIDANLETFKLKSGNGVFNEAEIKKIMANENLAEMALADPKRVKRILANRQSAARSKERKMRYITELEIKVQTLQTETTSLSAQLMLLQRDSSNLTSQNNELKFRLQAMEQQAQLRDGIT